MTLVVENRKLRRAVLAWPALTLLCGLGYLSFEASHHLHRHWVGGIVRAHDHLSAGPHHHDDENAPGDPGEPRSPQPRRPVTYLGQAPVYALADSGLIVSVRPVMSCDPLTASLQIASPKERPGAPRPPRAPPGQISFAS